MLHIATYSPESISNISKSNFLNTTDLAFIKEISSELQDTFEKKQLWRTETEINVSVLNDISFPTPVSKYWQAVREQAVFYDNLITLSFDYRKNEVAIKQIQRDLDDLQRQLVDNPLLDLNIELKQIELEEVLFKRANFELAAKDRVREIRIWSNIKDELVTQDPTFDTQDVNKHQLVSYGQQFLLELEVLHKTKNPSFGEVQSALSKLLTTLKKGIETNTIEEMFKPINNPDLKTQILNTLIQTYPEISIQITNIAKNLRLLNVIATTS